MTERGSNLGTEVRGGIVTFVTMSYIVVLNPLIVGTAKDVNGNYPGGGQDIGTSIALVAAATALDCRHHDNLHGRVRTFPYRNCCWFRS
jgi:adenine/guanine/hypoxanthine permease